MNLWEVLFTRGDINHEWEEIAQRDLKHSLLRILLSGGLHSMGLRNISL